MTHQEAEQIVRQLYRELLRREPGGGEEQGWVNALVGGTATMEQVRQGFINSDEYRRRQAMPDGYEVIGREGDVGGEQFYRYQDETAVHRLADGMIFENLAQAKFARGPVEVEIRRRTQTATPPGTTPPPPGTTPPASVPGGTASIGGQQIPVVALIGAAVIGYFVFFND